MKDKLKCCKNCYGYSHQGQCANPESRMDGKEVSSDYFCGVEEFVFRVDSL